MNRFRDIVRTSSEKMKHIQKWNEAEEQELWNAHKLFKCDWDRIASHVANGSIATEVSFRVTVIQHTYVVPDVCLAHYIPLPFSLVQT